MYVTSPLSLGGLTTSKRLGRLSEFVELYSGWQAAREGFLNVVLFARKNLESCQSSCPRRGLIYLPYCYSLADNHRAQLVGVNPSQSKMQRRRSILSTALSTPT